ncbi:MAG TPA: ligase-associated DNA damage response exonuclease [Bryobacteraceae bacterium]|nr:ligase-associated DNA damage response exonuclease [Bryobacteraceae bacterium]
MLQVDANGLYCAAGRFYIDPWGPVDRAIITHAHADHARSGAKRYLTAEPGRRVLGARLGDSAAIEGVDYGSPVWMDGVRISLHPSGHVLGSAQVRLEHAGEVWVVSGDYKIAPDRTCAPFDPVRCDTFVTEATFGLPIYRWRPQEEVFQQVNRWWRSNQEKGKASVIFAYSLGKAQRVLAGVDPATGPIYTHGAVERMTGIYRQTGIALPETRLAVTAGAGDWARSLILAPPLANGTPWMRRFGRRSTGFASGWMRIRGARRRRAIDRGFVLSDHADWPGLLAAIESTGASRVWVTHGYRSPMVRWLREKGLQAEPVETRYEGEQDEAPGDPGVEVTEDSE